MDNGNSFKNKLVTSIILFIVSIIVTLVLTLAWLGVFGIPIGLFFIALSIWYFSMWFYNKNIPFKIASILFFLPILSIISSASERSTYVWSQAHTPLGQTLPTQPTPFWFSIASFIPLILWPVGLILIIWFFVKAKKL